MPELDTTYKFSHSDGSWLVNEGASVFTPQAKLALLAVLGQTAEYLVYILICFFFRHLHNIIFMFPELIYCRHKSEIIDLGKGNDAKHLKTFTIFFSKIVKIKIRFQIISNIWMSTIKRLTINKNSLDLQWVSPGMMLSSAVPTMLTGELYLSEKAFVTNFLPWATNFRPSHSC